ncbi:MAG: sulfite exporter TauE/SafE family protein [Pseudomonadota bacterium]|nr:sulfite exporter TauE/SafE family protein [Pseudomonadota bacterium]
MPADLTLWQDLLLALIGVVAGFLNVMAGGGSLLTVPVMVFMGMPGPVANGTNRIAILAQNITAVITFFRRGFSDFRLSLTLAACAVPGAVLGAWVGTRLEGIWFNRVLALIMVGVMVVMSFKPKTKLKPRLTKPDSGRQLAGLSERQRIIWAHVLMVGAGLYGGFIQIGVGFILMAILHRVLGLDLVRVNMHKVFIVLCYTIAALAVFASQLQLMWIAGASLAVGNSIGGWLGAHTAVHRGERWVRFVLNAVLVVFIVKLLFA